MNAIQLLKQDHQRMKHILDALEETTERGVKTREELYAKMRTALTIHEEIEEKILYPVLKSHPKLKDIVLEGYEEHHVADLIVAELDGLPVDDETWGAKLKVMKENIEHHIEEEEEKMFLKAADELSRTELQELGEQMEAYKKELEGKALPKAS